MEIIMTLAVIQCDNFNDMLLKIDDKEISPLSMEEFTEYMHKSKKDIKVVTILRKGKEVVINL